LQTLLGEQEPDDIRSLVARADKLWATHKPQSHNQVASVDTAEEQMAQIAAIQAASGSSSGSGSGSGPVSLLTPSKHGSALDSAFTIGLKELGPASVWPPSFGWETRVPRRAKRRRPWVFGPCDGPDFWPAFFGGHRGNFQHHPSFLQLSCFWSYPLHHLIFQWSNSFGHCIISCSWSS
jgi:hypothetical protein